MSKGILAGLGPGLDSVLALRDTLGLAQGDVHLVTRKWTGKVAGEGDYEDIKEKMFPPPAIQDLSQDLRLVEGGALKSGDLILKSISKNKYKREDLLNETNAKNVESFYLINQKHYKAMNIKEQHLTWSVSVRPQTGG